MSKDVLEELEAQLEAGGTITNLDIAISGGTPVEGLLETKEGILKTFGNGPIDYGVTTTEIEALQEKALALKVSDEKLVIASHQRAKAIRIQIESKRKEHKEVAIQYGKRVDDGAKVLKELIEPVEDSLKKLREEAEEIKAKVKREAEAAERALVDSRLKQLAELEWAANALVVAEMSDEDFDEELAKASEYFSVIKAKRDADTEVKRLADEAEKERIRLIQEQAERDRKELEELRALKRQQEIDAKAREEEETKRQSELTRQMQAEREAAEREAETQRRDELAAQQVEFDRQQEILRKQFAAQQAVETQARLEAEAKAKSIQEENDRLERMATLARLEKEAEEQAKKDEEERIRFEAEEAEKKRVAAEARAKYLESIKPDAEKIRAFGVALSNWLAANEPELSMDEAKATMVNVQATLDEACGLLMDFGMDSNGSMPF